MFLAGYYFGLSAPGNFTILLEPKISFCCVHSCFVIGVMYYIWDLLEESTRFTCLVLVDSSTSLATTIINPPL